MDKQPDLLDQLSQAAREQALDEQNRLDPRWDRLAAGQLTEEENDELLGLADASGEAHEAYQAFKPLGPAFESRVAAAILARQQVEAEERLAAELATAAAVPASPAQLASPPARRAWYLGGLGSVLAAATVAFVVSLPAQLPSYVPEKLASISPDRGGIDLTFGVPVYTAGNEVMLEAEARVRPGKDPDARLFYVGEDQRLQSSDLEAKIEDEGRRIRFLPILGEDLELAPGKWRLVMVVSRPGEFPGPATILEAVSAGGQPSKYWQVLVYQIEVEQLEMPGAD
jgi:hypothetical protein